MNMYSPNTALMFDAVDRYADLSEQIRRLDAERDMLRKSFIKITGGDGILRGRVHALKVTTSTSRRLDVTAMRDSVDAAWLAQFEKDITATKINTI